MRSSAVAGPDARRVGLNGNRLPTIALTVAGFVAAAGCGRIHYDPVVTDAAFDATRDAAADTLADTNDAGADTFDARVDVLPDAFDARVDSPSTDVRDAGVDVVDVTMDVVSDRPDGSTCSVPTSPDFCLTLPGLPVAPIIDGMPECGIMMHDLMPMAWSGVGPIPPGNSARFAAAWRPDGIYVVVAVTDPTRFPATGADLSFCGDAVEIFADSDGIFTAAPNYDDPGTSQIVVPAPADATTPSMRADIYRQGTFRHAAAPTVGAFPTPGGYVVEVLITAADLDVPTFALSTGPRVGLDLAIDVSDGAADAGFCGSRLGQYFLHIDSGGTGSCGLPTPTCDVRAFCLPVLTP